uniref:Uncharacterized protein n=1 Tax=Arundo donax TaxID=35708 RepID=A0A0A9H6K8_ARUDO
MVPVPGAAPSPSDGAPPPGSHGFSSRRHSLAAGSIAARRRATRHQQRDIE